MWSGPGLGPRSILRAQAARLMDDRAQDGLGVLGSVRASDRLLRALQRSEGFPRYLMWGFCSVSVGLTAQVAGMALAGFVVVYPHVRALSALRRSSKQTAESEQVVYPYPTRSFT